MSYTEQFVLLNNLQPADAILLKKKFMGMLDHFAVYLGRHVYTNEPVFAANYTKGVQVLEHHEVNTFLTTLVPDKIERFTGSYHQRIEAVERAKEMVGKTGYNLLSNNCEHYKNYVLFNKKFSNQVDSFGKVAAVGGGVAVLAGLASKNNKAVGWGLFALALGALAAGAASQDK
jgi:hypothetical protein